MLPRPAAVCYWVVIPWLQGCVPPGTGWECACPGVSTQAKLTAANFKFQLQEDGCTGVCRLNVLLSSTDQSLSTRPLPTYAVVTPGAVMVLFGATLSLENVLVGLLCTALELSCALC